MKKRVFWQVCSVAISLVAAVTWRLSRKVRGKTAVAAVAVAGRMPDIVFYAKGGICVILNNILLRKKTLYLSFATYLSVLCFTISD